MSLLLMLALLAAVPTVKPAGVVEATIHGTKQALEVDLLLRDPNDEWKNVAHRTLPPGTRRVRFEGLGSGVYQVLVRGTQATEQHATKIVIGGGDMRHATIDVEPFVVTGRLTYGGTHLGGGGIMLRNRDFQWRALVRVGADGTFRVPMWQRGTYTCVVRDPALPTPYTRSLEIAAKPVTIDIPDGRIRGIVRDAKTGAPVDNALILLHTVTANSENNVNVRTSSEGRFDFAGIEHGRQTVRILPPHHLEPAPISFTLDDNARLRELDVPLDSGRSVAVLVIDRENHPAGNAKVFAVSNSQICSRATTDEDGRATVPIPNGETATLFVIAEAGPFGMLRVGREEQRGRIPIQLPRTTSSLLIRALTTDGRAMPPFSLLMRFNGELVPPEVADELAATQGFELATGAESEAHLAGIPSGSYEFWPYRTEQEAESIVAAGALFPPIQVDVRSGENKIAVKFAPRLR